MGLNTFYWYETLVLDSNVVKAQLLLVRMEKTTECFCYRHQDSSLSEKKIYQFILKIVSEYNQEIPQSQTADNRMAPRGRATQPSRDTRKTNKAKQPALFSPSR